jgi:protein-S-isoprenylcysteine O-methyltransferase Ste14
METPRAPGRISAWLAVRSLAWTILIPGTVTGYLPWSYFGLRDVHPDPRDLLDVLGLLTAAAGAALLLACIWEFASSGRGTLAPLDPPRELVVRGLYRHVRNPMYVGVTTLLAGELLLVRSRAMLDYVLVWLVAVNVFVLAYEEPTLRAKFGESYERYTKEVGRWLPSFRRRDSGR